MSTPEFELLILRDAPRSCSLFLKTNRAIKLKLKAQLGTLSGCNLKHRYSTSPDAFARFHQHHKNRVIDKARRDRGGELDPSEVGVGGPGCRGMRSRGSRSAERCRC